MPADDMDGKDGHFTWQRLGAQGFAALVISTDATLNSVVTMIEG
jgi:hypothetical protein